MPVDKIRVGIIGANVHYGWGSRAQLPALAALPDFEVTAVCTTHQETAEETARQFEIPLAFHNAAELAHHPRVDLVIVCVRVPAHYPLVMMALQAGKHVFCEWPLGANLQEAVAMRDLAEAQGVHHMVGLQARGAPAFNRIKALVAEGYLGQILSCTLHYSASGAGQRTAGSAWAADRAKGASTLTIQGGHSIDALRFCLGEFRELSATVATQIRHATIVDSGETLAVTTPDQVLVDGTLRSGAVASIHIQSVPAHGSGFALAIHGTAGVLRASSAVGAQIGELVLVGARTSDETLAPVPVPAEYRWVPPDVPSGPPFNVAQLLQTFAQSIRDGTPASPDFTVAVQLHELLEAIQRASDTGQRQQLG